jgi:glycosyltransferase involved in cell wall biosynthesis
MRLMNRPDLRDLPAIPRDERHWPWVTSALESSHDGNASNAPRITVVTPSLNQGQFIEETIRSVLMQGYPNLEYIVIDGGSTDQSVEIIKRYEPWLAHWVSEKDRGQSHAINKGFAAATGTILCYLNSDDILFPGVLHAVASEFAANDGKGLLCCAGEFFGTAMAEVLGPAAGEGADATRRWQPAPRQRLTGWLTTYASLFQQSCFWDRALHDAIGGFSEDLHFCFDKEFFLRAIFEFGAYTPRADIVAAGHRLHGDCKTATISDVMVRENELLWARYGNQKWCREILQREAREDRSHDLMATALSHPSLLGRASSLARSARAWPGVMRSRMFWGAVRRLLHEPSADS